MQFYRYIGNSYVCIIFLFDIQNFHFEEGLAVTVAAEITGLLFVLHHQNFSGSAYFLDFGFHFRAFNIRRADSGVLAVINQQNFIERNLVSDFVFSLYFFNGKKIIFGDFVLLPACLYDRKFHKFHIIWISRKRQPSAKTGLVWNVIFAIMETICKQKSLKGNFSSSFYSPLLFSLFSSSGLFG